MKILLALICSAAMLAAPLTSAEAGQLKELAKISLKINGMLAKQALTPIKESVKFNARVTVCGVKILAHKPC